ncbi:hypothetical protein MBLNU459_g2606t2 [Dothideomycetes sp. NU459]
MTSGELPTLDQLRLVVRTCPAIDNHAHNLLLPSEQEAYSLLGATTEAQGDAQEDTFTSLPHLRAVRQLRELYGSHQDADWKALMDKRHELLTSHHDSLLRTCFEGIHTILMDDGLDGANVHPYDWHDQFTQSKTLRVVRIETVAADIMRGMYHDGKLPIGLAIADEEPCETAWITFLGAFEAAIAAEIRDPKVAGFKSVICYRTGLDVRIPMEVEVATNGLDSFREEFLPTCVQNDFRISHKGLNDCILISTCRLLAAGLEETGIGKPLQFHTGLGDADISLLRSDPSYLQPLIAKFPTVKIVLLHSSYPYTRQAGYLATVYKNVYLDLGEVFPQLLYSTDAHHFGEVYWLANKQFRHAFEKVLVDYVQNDDLTVQQAIDAAKDIYFNNSQRIYNLGLSLPATNKAQLQLTWSDSTEFSSTANPYDLSALPAFVQKRPALKYVYVQWLDYMGTMRVRVVPLKYFQTMISNGTRIGIARGNTGTLQNDAITSAVDTQGMIFVEPDLRTLRVTHSKDPLASATVIASFRSDNGRPLPACPRSTLQMQVDRFQHDYAINFLLGFEIELTILRPTGDKYAPYLPLDSNHAWATLTPEQFSIALPLIGEIVTELEEMGISIQQFHSESGPGQYELVLPPLPAVLAIDTLIQARQAIQQIVHTHGDGLRATLHPKPLANVGSGQHAHLSLNSTSLTPAELAKRDSSFFAAVLAHLPSICAFTLPNEASYARVGDDLWSGGAWIAWGTQNREVPLRKVDSPSTRWELRCVDGFANPYLAIAAVLAAGSLGVKAGEEMEMEDCLENPARLSDEQRRQKGIERRLPTTLGESLFLLEADDELKDVLGRTLTEDYIAMKRAEEEMLDDMPEHERHVWLVERY